MTLGKVGRKNIRLIPVKQGLIRKEMTGKDPLPINRFFLSWSSSWVLEHSGLKTFLLLTSLLKYFQVVITHLALFFYQHLFIDFIFTKENSLGGT